MSCTVFLKTRCIEHQLEIIIAVNKGVVESKCRMGNYFKNEFVRPETKVLEDNSKEKASHIQEGCGNSLKVWNHGTPKFRQ